MAEAGAGADIGTLVEALESTAIRRRRGRFGVLVAVVWSAVAGTTGRRVAGSRHVRGAGNAPFQRIVGQVLKGTACSLTRL